MLKKIKLKDAVGTKLAHDITEIRPGEFKGPAFHKGHTVCNDDICRLQKLGKNNLYVIDLEEDEIHEDQAAAILADALAGDGIAWKDEPHEGKINLVAKSDGLFKVDTTALAAFNMVDEVMCATLHNHTLVKKGEKVAATRAIPLVMKRVPIERAATIARQNGAVLAVKSLRQANVGLVVTEAATESTTIISTAPERISVSVILSASSPLSGCETIRLSRSTPTTLA